MIICIANVLPPDRLADVQAKLGAARFSDGRLTAGWHASLVKRNTQADRSVSTASLQKLVLEALRANLLFQMAARPLRIVPPLFSRYEVGMEYGTHVDDAVMASDSPVRTDIAFTLFLSDPASYDGGELVVDSTGGEQVYKLDAGSMIVYPASSLHRVAPVTRGVRLACVSWVQSQVRDPAQRELLFDLDTARRTLFERAGKTPEFDLISKSMANLQRMWADV